MTIDQHHRHSFRFRVIALAAGSIGFFATGYAVAGCPSYIGTAAAPPAGWSTEAAEASTQATTALASGSSFNATPQSSEGEHAAAIVGTWKVTLISDGTAYPGPIPTGAVIDFGTSQWHGDGTEFLISGARPPSTGDVCMGSWERTGRNVYTLRHIALAWVSPDSTPPAPAAAFLGPAILHEVVSLSRSGRSYAGSFTIDQYAADGTTLLEHIGGKTTGVRF